MIDIAGNGILANLVLCRPIGEEIPTNYPLSHPNQVSNEKIDQNGMEISMSWVGAHDQPEEDSETMQETTLTDVQHEEDDPEPEQLEQDESHD